MGHLNWPVQSEKCKMIIEKTAHFSFTHFAFAHFAFFIDF